MEEKTMTTEEAILFLTNQLDDEVQRSEAYRASAIALLDAAAESAVETNRAARDKKRKRNEDIMNLYPPSSNSTH